MPYTKIINENNIIIGLGNIHFRFGHISIIQYLNAAFNNHILNNHGILLPTASIFSFFIIYLIKEIINNFHKKSYCIFLFFIFSYSIYGYSRYSEFGNDVIAHLYLILTFIFFQKYFDKDNIDSNLINKLFLLSFFSFLQKTTMLFGILIPFYCLIFLKKKLSFFKFFNLLPFAFLIFWFIKNLLISGCMIYPVPMTCFEKFNWYTNNINYQISAIHQSLENEAWSKGYPDQKGSQLSFEEYISNFNWIKTWLPNHGLLIFKKISIFIFFMLFFFFLVKKKKITNNDYNDNKTLILLVISTLGSIVWFIRFPTYRYGSSYIVMTFILINIFYFHKNYKFVETVKFKKIILFFLIIFISLFIMKNSIRILKNFKFKYYDYPWPRIYGDNITNYKNKSHPVINNKKIIYYKSDTICMYSSAPCTHFDVKNIIYREKFIFKIFNIK